MSSHCEQYIILAMHARPVPSDPYNPTPPQMNAAGQPLTRHPSPFIPVRLPIFALVIWLNDRIVAILNVGGRTTKRTEHSKRRRALSEAVESVEEGDSIEMNPIPEPWKASRPEAVQSIRTARGKRD